MTDRAAARRRTRSAVLRSAPAARPYARTAPLTIEEVELEPPRRGEALVRIEAAGLCHSDLSVINGDRPRPMPMALGHEAAGVVEEVGPGVSRVAPGDHVVMVFVPSCGACGPCAEGRAALCEPGAAANAAGELLGGGVRMRAGGAPVRHHVGVSAFGERAVLSERSLVRVDRDLPFEHAALFGCAVLTGVGAVVNSAGARPGETVAVVGLGGVGLSALLGALAAGASEAIAVDIDPAKLDFARALGATAVFDSRDPEAAAAIRARTGGGVDHAIETAGVGPAFDFAYEIGRRGGQTVTASLANPAVKLSLQQVRMVGEERTVRGSYLGGGVPARDIARAVALFRRGRLPVDRLMTSTGPLEEINAAFDRLAEGATVRHVLRMGRG